MGDSAHLLKGKKGLVMGVANDRSLAWGISKAITSQGAEVAFTFQKKCFHFCTFYLIITTLV